MLDDVSTIEYIRRAKEGDNTAKEMLVEHNVSLVKCIVKRYLGKGVDDIVAHVVTHVHPGDVLLVMSNGGFGGIHTKLLSALAQ